MSGSRRKARIGQVVSDKADKTVVVAVKWQQRHPLYGKSIRRITRFSVHDEQNLCHIGDQVRIVETRPLSKTKRWRVLEILAKGEVPEVLPQEIDIALEEAPSAATTGVRVEEIPVEALSSMAPGTQVPPVEAPVAEAAEEPREAQVSPVEAQVTEVAREPETALVPSVEAQVTEVAREPETALVPSVEAQVTEVAREPETALVPPVEAQVMIALEEPETTTQEEEPER